MALNVFEGQCCLKCFETEPADNAVEPAITEQSHDLSQLKEKVVSHLGARQFKYLEIHRWNAVAGEWAIQRSFKVE
ncbi:MAG: hypothetical protein FJX31_06695 [Alphaproteobacteria bacterium]|nr:hypothetical protein [Alphaproteobacteria bacterium]